MSQFSFKYFLGVKMKGIPRERGREKGRERERERKRE